MGCTLAPSGKYIWTICVQWRCGLMSNYFRHFLKTSGQSNFDIRPHCCSRRTVHSYSPGGANVPSHNNNTNICNARSVSKHTESEDTLAPAGEYDWTCASFDLPESTTQTANWSVRPFLHSLWKKVPILYNGCPFPSKLPLPMGDLDTHLTHDSLGPSEPTTRMASQSVQLFFAGLTGVEDRPTDHAT